MGCLKESEGGFSVIYQREEGNEVQEKESIGLEEDAVPASIGNLTI